MTSLRTGRNHDQWDTRTIAKEINWLDVTRIVVAPPSSAVMMIAVFCHNCLFVLTALTGFFVKPSKRSHFEEAG